MAGQLEGSTRVLPRYLRVQSGWLYTRLAEAETALTDHRLIVAEARRLPHPQYTAELATFDPDDVNPPWKT